VIADGYKYAPQSEKDKASEKKPPLLKVGDWPFGEEPDKGGEMNPKPAGRKKTRKEVVLKAMTDHLTIAINSGNKIGNWGECPAILRTLGEARAKLNLLLDKETARENHLWEITHTVWPPDAADK
jgi:hypothetical protein